MDISGELDAGAQPLTDRRALEHIAGRVFPGSKVRRAWALAGGMSAQMRAVEVEKASGETGRFVLRSYMAGKPAGAAQLARERRVLDFLEKQTLPAPRPYLLDVTLSIVTFPYLVTSYCDGLVELAPADPIAAVRQMAVQLATIHQAGAASSAAALVEHMPRSCAEGPRIIPAGSSLRYPLERIGAALKRMPPPGPNPPTILHGDYWPGNILWQGERLSAVLDWEDAAFGDPLIDLARTRSELVWIYGPDAAAAFTALYLDHSQADPGGLRYWDLCAALREVRLVAADPGATAAYFALRGRPDINEQVIETQLVQFMEAALAHFP